MIELRANQVSLLEEVLDVLNEGVTRILVAAPTGYGKTIIYAALLARLGLPGRVLVTSNDLRIQLSQRLTSMGLNMPVDTVQSAIRERPSSIGVLILDEAHNFVSNSWSNIVNIIDASYLFGFSATPYRADLKPLLSENGGPFECFIEGPTVAELTADGSLANLVIESVGLEEVTKEYPVYEGERLVGYKTVVTVEPADLSDQGVDEYLERFSGQSAITFCKSIAHAEQVAQDFRDQGVEAVSIHGQMSKGERASRWERMANGSARVATVRDLGAEGIDNPRLKVAIMMRKISGSMRLYVQGIGRILRPYENQQAYLLDLVGNFYRYGDPADITAGDYAA